MNGCGRWSTERTGESLSLFRRHRPEVLQIALVPDEHDDNVGVGVVAKLLEPASHVDIRGMLRDVVDEKCANGATVIAISAVHMNNDCEGVEGITDAAVIARYRSCPAVVDQ